MGSTAGQNATILGSLGTFTRVSQQAVVSHYNVRPVIDIFGSIQGMPFLFHDVYGFAVEYVAAGRLRTPQARERPSFPTNSVPSV